MVTSANGDLAVITTSAASDERRRALEYRGVRVVVFDGPGGRADLTRLPAFLAAEHYRSLMIESGSKLNWAVLESRIADKIFFYYAPKILGGLRSLPVAGGTGRLRRTDAIQFHNVRIHSIPPDEFVVEAWVDK
jgi:diaminohydroxyphosphoribosylaminopyrimidine deaminase/5-amino-6-(5-phosphoribosylamino)uracil reductase